MSKYAYFRMPIGHSSALLDAARMNIEHSYAFTAGAPAEPVGIEGDEVLYRIAVPDVPDYRDGEEWKP